MRLTAGVDECLGDAGSVVGKLTCVKKKLLQIQTKHHNLKAAVQGFPTLLQCVSTAIIWPQAGQG
jgi:hypothetical protein